MRAIALIAVASCCFIALGPPDSVRAAPSCEAIRAELAQTPVVIGNSQDVRAYSGAVTRQDFEIRKLQRTMQQAGCSSSIAILNGHGQDLCAPMQESLAVMQENKRQLLIERNAAGMKGGVNPRHEELTAALQSNGCDVTEPAPALQDTDDGQETVRPYEAPVYPDYPLRNEAPISSSSDGLMLPSGQGGYRTLCVRTCDGGFFPISPSTPARDFGRDAETCNRLCPGTEAELYYSRLTDEAKDMVSTVTGQPYRDMPNAFAYLNRAPGQPGQCSCNRASSDGLQTNGPKPGLRTDSGGSSVISITSNGSAPGTRQLEAPSGAQDKTSTDQKATTGMEATNKPAPEPEAVSRPYDPGRQSVRRVGPTFLPSNTSQIDLVHPALPGAQPVQE
ncbi:DUF2865 domain-containing protein [Agrobacterium vitis]|uniref:DUF2865 domain-containing protein n=1 Tax=Agrobacterium vitis TaxID=373 RepID=A0A6L6V8P1_AGRVI|nr:DUF2865 domain-containing protein [Agrobacterium vitis]MUZ72114.1 DUF2865 domain-containing protein [Agrobacterium vitis]